MTRDTELIILNFTRSQMIELAEIARVNGETETSDNYMSDIAKLTGKIEFLIDDNENDSREMF